MSKLRESVKRQRQRRIENEEENKVANGRRWRASRKDGLEPACGRRARQNVGSLERLLSLGVGSTLVTKGISRQDGIGLLAGLIGGGLIYRGWSGYCPSYAALGINRAAQKPATVIPAKTGVKVEWAVTINRPAQDLYIFWRDFENLPQAMQHLKKVEAIDQLRSRWVADGAFGREVEWEAEIIQEHENELISWRSLPESEIDMAGSVRFRTLGQDRGTEVTVSLQYRPAGGKLGARLAALFGQDLEQKLIDDLYNFKRLMEAHELPAIVGPPNCHP